MSKLFSKRRKSSADSKGSKKSNKSKKYNIKSKINNRTSHWDFNKITRYTLVFAVLIGLVTSYFWYSKVYITPERRFWTAIDNSMATPSVVRTLTEGGTGNQVEQLYRFNFAPQRVVQNKVEYTEKSATTDTSVTTEGIIFPTEQFLRYTQFYNSRNDGESSANLDSVLGQWAKQTSDQVEEAKLNYLSEQVSLVIFGNYGPNVRNEILNEMKSSNVYGEALSIPLEDTSDGEAVYVYQISVKLKKYAEILNKAFVDAGYGEFAPLNPENYRDDSTVNGNVIVIKKNNSIVGVSFGGREEKYGNYGVTATVETPQTDLTVEELQSQVQQLLQSAQ